MKRTVNIFSIAMILALMVSMVGIATPAYAATQTLGGTATMGNLRIAVSDNGMMKVEQYDGFNWVAEFYEYGGVVSKGSTLWVGNTAYSLGYPMTNTAATPVSNLTSGNTITTQWKAGGVTIKQITTYTNGNGYYDLQWNITTTSATDLKFFHAGDSYLAGSDQGSGWWGTMGANTVGVTNPGSGQKMWLTGTTAPTHHESDYYNDVENNIVTGALSDMVDPDPTTDNGYGLEWDKTVNGIWTIKARESFVLPAPSGTEMLCNGKFNVYPTTAIQVPSCWIAAKFGPGDGKDTVVKKEGYAAVKFIGNAGSPTKSSGILQVHTKLSGKKGDSFIFSYWLKGFGIPSASTFYEVCRGHVYLYKAGALFQTIVINCPAGTYNWKKVSASFTAKDDYDKVTIKFGYSKPSGTVWFDWASLLKMNP